MKSRKLSFVCGVCFTGAVTASASAAILFQACPPGCGGNLIRHAIDTSESEYTCCTPGGLCKVCDDCPWYLELFC